MNKEGRRTKSSFKQKFLYFTSKKKLHYLSFDKKPTPQALQGN